MFLQSVLLRVLMRGEISALSLCVHKELSLSWSHSSVAATGLKELFATASETRGRVTAKQ